MSNKGKQVPATNSKKRSYISWDKKMDEVLISVLYDQISQGNKADGDWKPQAYQAVVDKLKDKLKMTFTIDHVRNHVKIWKKRYGIIMDIRTKTKFKWDDVNKMIDIPIEDMAEWKKYTMDNPNAAHYENKRIENWDDISFLVGPDRALGDGGEHFEEGAEAMEGEASEVKGSSADTTCGTRKRRKDDQLNEVISDFVSTFQTYVESKMRGPPTLSGKEVHDVVSKVDGILPHQLLNAVSVLMKSPQKFQLLKDFPEDKKLDWIIFCIRETPI